ncbi:MAG: CHAT domain-containing protein [Bacteroidota bacterium]
MPDQTPVILLAFANDRQGTFLRNISQEQQAISDALKPAERNGWVQVEIIAAATVQKIIDTFLEYKDRIVLFHYGGHADGESLLLSSGDNATAVDAQSFAAFLALQKGMKLVFLNGCDTYQQAEALEQAGIGQVIVTDREIDDEAAKDFARYFYGGLAQKSNVKSAFDQAETIVKLGKGGATRALYWSEKQINPEKTYDEAPWELFVNPSADASWNLAQNELGIILDSLRGKMRNDKTEQVLRELGELAAAKNSEFENEITLLSTRFKSLKKKRNLGLLSTSEASLENNKINYAVLELMDMIEEQGL